MLLGLVGRAKHNDSLPDFVQLANTGDSTQRVRRYTTQTTAFAPDFR